MTDRRLSLTEFVALMGILTATIAFSIDAMLPALPSIAESLSPGEPNRVQLIVTVFVFGVGIGTLLVGALSDAFGRKPVMAGFAALFIVGAAAGAMADSLETMLAARLIQGIGAAGPRVCTLAIVRDLYSGRQMARIMSFVFLVFALIPTFAPAIGAGVLAIAGWRAIFVLFVCFAVVSIAWLLLRQPETLAAENRRPLELSSLRQAFVEIVSHRTVMLAIAVQALSFGCLFAVLSSVQQSFDVTFGKGAQFHLWFGLIGLLAATASAVNARLVVRLGMRRMVRAILTTQICIAASYLLGTGVGWPSQSVHFVAFFIWTTSVFFMAGLTIGNLNAIAMEPMGHVAGMAASVIGAIATMASAVLAMPLAAQFDGTPAPIAFGVLCFASIGYGLMRVLGTRGEAPA